MHLNRFGIANHSNFNERCSLLASRIQVGYDVQYLCSITTRKHGIDEIVYLPSPKAVYTLHDTLWMCRYWLEIPNNPSWSGYMALATEGNKTYQQNWGSSTTIRSRYNTSIYSSWPMRTLDITPETVREMIPHVHAAGHLAYAKYTHLYLQQKSDF